MKTTTLQLNPSTLPRQALYGNGETVGWELSPVPFNLTEKQVEDLNRFGEVLWKFIQGIDKLYKESQKESQPLWASALLEQGKPESLLKFSAMKRFKSQFPLVIRPDLLITEAGWALCEIDAVPGGIGFTSALNQAYRESGFPILEATETMPIAFLDMLKSQYPEKPEPTIAIILSDEAGDYRSEMLWLVEKIQVFYPHIHLIHPKQVDLVKDQLVFQSESGEEKSIDIIYRFFELFDLPNIPKIELIQYAVKKGLVRCTPPFKPHLEEKSPLVLLHHPVLKGFWVENLGKSDFEWLSQWIPKGWVADPQELPPQAIIPGLTPGGRAIQSFRQLSHLSQKERTYVLKPSGFSPLAWGSRGVTVGHDVSQEIWQEKLEEALNTFPQTPYLLQEYMKPMALPIERFKDIERGEVETFQGRVRLCPYYFIEDGKPKLTGILATACPADKKVIHGMKDAVLAPCMGGPL